MTVSPKVMNLINGELVGVVEKGGVIESQGYPN